MRSYRVYVPLATIFFCISAIVSAHSGVIVKERTTYYQLDGKNGRQLIKGFKADKNKSGYAYLKSSNRLIAYVHFEVDVVNVRKQHSPHYCFIHDADVVIKAHYLFPKWKGKKRGSLALQKTWQEFMDYAVWHEKQHVEITKEYARNYITLLKQTKFPLLGDCNVMPKETQKSVARMVKQMKAKQDKFDRSEAKPGGRSYMLQAKLRKTK